MTEKKELNSWLPGVFLLLEGTKYLNPLLEKYNDYKSICNFCAEYELETGDTIRFKIEKAAFIHLCGIHKLKDLYLIQLLNNPRRKEWTVTRVCREIEKERLTDSQIRKSIFFSEIKDRYENLNTFNLLYLQYTDVIIDFNPLLVHSSLKAQYIFFDHYKSGVVNHLCLAKGKNGVFYIESFFTRKDFTYTEGQNTVRVKTIQLVDDSGNVYLSESFN